MDGSTKLDGHVCTLDTLTGAPNHDLIEFRVPVGAVNHVHIGTPARITLNPEKAEEHTTGVRPVVSVVAHALDEVSTLDAIVGAASPVDAVLVAAERGLPQSPDVTVLVAEVRHLRTELSADRKAIGVLGVAVGKVGDLHRADEDGFCRACQTTVWPCATAKAIGAGQ